MSINSRAKGARGEREWRDYVKVRWGCPDARRGCQHSGGPDSPDVTGGVPGTHGEVKRVESLNIHKAMAQAARDAGHMVPYVAHRRNGEDWLLTLRADDAIDFARRLIVTVEAIS